ncbi:CG-1 DNA-binding domain [Trinorchestia longiramus]|nr:CG-1 DNA-binding domain [Trinorchestia longiramus]
MLSSTSGVCHVVQVWCGAGVMWCRCDVVQVWCGADYESVRLPDNLESIPKADHFPPQRHRWNTNEEIAALLICFDRHCDWLSKEVKIRPKSGSMLLYSRKKVRYRRDGYCWKKRKDGKTTREDHMKLKVQGIEVSYLSCVAQWSPVPHLPFLVCTTGSFHFIFLLKTLHEAL